MSHMNEKLDHVRHDVCLTAHIVRDAEKCSSCTQRACLYFCPASCFTVKDDEIDFRYEGCLECGTCRIVCPYDALDWHYPLGGFGVTFRLG